MTPHMTKLIYIIYLELELGLDELELGLDVLELGLDELEEDVGLIELISFCEHFFELDDKNSFSSIKIFSPLTKFISLQEPGW